MCLLSLRNSIIYSRTGELPFPTEGVNTAANCEDGGGLFNSGTATITNSVLLFNNSYSSGRSGGIYNSFTGSTTITNSTLFANEARFSGSGLFNFGTAPWLTDKLLESVFG